MQATSKENRSNLLARRVLCGLGPNSAIAWFLQEEIEFAARDPVDTANWDYPVEDTQSRRQRSPEGAQPPRLPLKLSPRQAHVPGEPSPRRRPLGTSPAIIAREKLTSPRKSQQVLPMLGSPRNSTRKSPRRSPVKRVATSTGKSPRKTLVSTHAHRASGSAKGFDNLYQFAMGLPGGDNDLWVTSPPKHPRPCLSASKRRLGSTGKRVRTFLFRPCDLTKPFFQLH